MTKGHCIFYFFFGGGGGGGGGLFWVGGEGRGRGGPGLVSISPLQITRSIISARVISLQ